MLLQDQLNAFKEQFKKQAPEAAFNAFARSTQELIESGQAEKALKVGDTAPKFVLTDAEGTEVSLTALLANGPVVLSFYRGVWCPYCNIELQALEAVNEELKARGATLAAISMQGAENSLKSQQENKLNFPILTDHAGEIADQFGIRWTLQDYVIEFHKMFKVVLPEIHGDGKWSLPMPARYVIATDGTIAYAEVNPDYTQRPEPSELLTVLDELSAKA
ncbi:peroxiredoxin-like family protein [Agarilytica rhodophyticola]|uniref:peroxiredoxin-like family protein n=1 Tax=Agarilytica rhodophyticola TaxID=1737490 RepID=UPI000B3432E4|nr:peroxiredoxin-like family protein [Agarilytica rhodophyticola]